MYTVTVILLIKTVDSGRVFTPIKSIATKCHKNYGSDVIFIQERHAYPSDTITVFLSLNHMCNVLLCMTTLVQNRTGNVYVVFAV